MTFIKTYRFLSFTLLISVFLTNCKKGEQTDPVSLLKGTYQSETYFNLSDIQMFTVNGQVQAPIIVSDFIKRRDLDFFSAKIQPLNSDRGTINFIGDGSATINLPDNNGIPTATKFTIIDKTASGFTLKQNDTLKNSIEKTNNRVAQLLTISNAVDQIVNCHASASGQTRCDYVRKLPFIVSNSAINLSYYSIAIHSEQPGLTQGYNLTNAPGVFNKTITKQLIAGDTLVVQTKFLQFSKK